MKRVLLIDYYNLFIRNWTVIPLQNENGEHYGAVVGSLRSIKSIINRTKATHVYVIKDGQKSALRRKMMLKEYKANRKKDWSRGACKVYDFLSEEEQQDNWNYQNHRLEEYFKILPFRTMEIPYVEADDVIAEIAQTIQSDSQVIIYSTDADYHQLINDNILCFNPITKKLWTRDSFLETKGLLPDNYIYLKSIMGDTSDNIPKVKGIGEKTFLKLFKGLDYNILESVDEMFDICQHALDSSSKSYTPGQLNKYKLILENEDKIRLNYNLMQLHDVNISVQSKDLIHKLIESPPNSFNKMKLRFMFMEDGIHAHLHKFGDWSRTFTKVAISGIMKGK